jgi:hypothetical protein
LVQIKEDFFVGVECRPNAIQHTFQVMVAHVHGVFFSSRQSMIGSND